MKFDEYNKEDSTRPFLVVTCLLTAVHLAYKAFMVATGNADLNAVYTLMAILTVSASWSALGIVATRPTWTAYFTGHVVAYAFFTITALAVALSAGNDAPEVRTIALQVMNMMIGSTIGAAFGRIVLAVAKFVVNRKGS